MKIMADLEPIVAHQLEVVPAEEDDVVLPPQLVENLQFEASLLPHLRSLRGGHHALEHWLVEDLLGQEAVMHLVEVALVDLLLHDALGVAHPPDRSNVIRSYRVLSDAEPKLIRLTDPEDKPDPLSGSDRV